MKKPKSPDLVKLQIVHEQAQRTLEETEINLGFLVDLVADLGRLDETESSAEIRRGSLEALRLLSEIVRGGLDKLLEIIADLPDRVAVKGLSIPRVLPDGVFATDYLPDDRDLERLGQFSLDPDANRSVYHVWRETPGGAQ